MLGSAFHKFQRVNSVTLSCDCMAALWACSAGMLPESPVRLGEAQHKVARNASSTNTISCNETGLVSLAICLALVRFHWRGLCSWFLFVRRQDCAHHWTGIRRGQTPKQVKEAGGRGCDNRLLLIAAPRGAWWMLSARLSCMVSAVELAPSVRPVFCPECTNFSVRCVCLNFGLFSFFSRASVPFFL